MKPFLGIDITENKKNEQYNGQEFIVASASAAQAQALEKASENAVDLIKRSQLPLGLRIAQWVCGLGGALIATGILKALTGEDSVSLAQAYQNASWLFWLAGAFLVVWAVLTLMSRKKQKTVMESDESNHVFNKLDVISGNIQAEFNIPSNAADVDILSFRYKLKDGEPVAKETGLDMTAYTNFEMSLFVDDGKLYLADLEHKYAFESSCLRTIRTVKKSIVIPDWNKEEEYNEGIYKSYKMSVDNYDCIHLKPYHILELEHEGQLWGIYFPCYELPVFEALTGLKAIT